MPTINMTSNEIEEIIVKTPKPIAHFMHHFKGAVESETIEEIANENIDFILYLDSPFFLSGLGKYISQVLKPTKGTWILKTLLFSFNAKTSFKALRLISLKLATFSGILTFLDNFFINL